MTSRWAISCTATTADTVNILSRHRILPRERKTKKNYRCIYFLPQCHCCTATWCQGKGVSNPTSSGLNKKTKNKNETKQKPQKSKWKSNPNIALYFLKIPPLLCLNPNKLWPLHKLNHVVITVTMATKVQFGCQHRGCYLILCAGDPGFQLLSLIRDLTQTVRPCTAFDLNLPLSPTNMVLLSFPFLLLAPWVCRRRRGVVPGRAGLGAGVIIRRGRGLLLNSPPEPLLPKDGKGWQPGPTAEAKVFKTATEY